jgi:excisionase family DNA binding protein
MLETDERLRTKREAAKFLQISEASIDRHRSTGALPCVKVGSLVRFTDADLVAFIESRRRAGRVAENAGDAA